MDEIYPDPPSALVSHSNAFASPNELFLAALRPLFVPIWTRAGNFKGMTARSIRDTTSFIKDIQEQRKGGNFVFLNLMETHLPFSPPDEFVRKFVPYIDEMPEAHQFMREFNRKAMQWLIPLIEPFTDIEAATLSDMYDAEVAYQDHLLGRLIEALDSPYHRDTHWSGRWQTTVRCLESMGLWDMVSGSMKN